MQATTEPLRVDLDLHPHPVLCARCVRVHDPDEQFSYHKHINERCENCGMLKETEACTGTDCAAKLQG